VKVSADGAMVHVKVTASQSQLEAIMALLTRALGGEMLKPKDGSTPL